MKEIRSAGNITYTLNRNRGQKNLRLHIGHGGEIIVSSPYYIRIREVESFVMSNLKWIEKHRSSMPACSFSDGDEIPYMGKSLVIRIESMESVSMQSESKKKACYRIIDDEICITVQNQDIDSIKEQIRCMYCDTVINIMKDRVPYWCGKLQVAVPQFGVNRAKTKWGVCYPIEKRLYLGYMCAILPYDLIDMTVLHEVCHLVHHGHGKDFWSLMESNMPDLKERKTRLAEIAKTGCNQMIV